MSPETIQGVEQLAKANNRTFSNMVNSILINEIKKNKNE